jgi:hypothetical protein
MPLIFSLKKKLRANGYDKCLSCEPNSLKLRTYVNVALHKFLHDFFTKAGPLS